MAKCDRCGKALDDNAVWHGGRHFCRNACLIAYARSWYDPLRKHTEALTKLALLEAISCPRCHGLGLTHNLGLDFECKLCYGTGRVSPQEAWTFIHEPPDPPNEQ